jgi:hypothetical protein
MKWPFSLSKKGQRVIDAKTAIGLVYDYHQGILDSERKRAFEAAMFQHPEVRIELEKIKAGSLFLEQLLSVEPKADLLAKILHPETPVEIFLKKIKFDVWPTGLKMSLETLLVVSIVAVSSVLIPWNQLTALRFGTESDVILAEINRQLETSPVAETEIADESAPAEAPFQDETPEASAIASTTTTTIAVAAAVPVAKQTTTTTTVAKTAAVTASPEKRQGFLFRGGIQVVNAGAASVKITNKLVELGGRKAGEVEMGWQREPNLYYYHFTIPEDRYDQLSSVFSEYGSLRLVKEKHERVMPEGIIRLIITVEDKTRAKK